MSRKTIARVAVMAALSSLALAAQAQSRDLTVVSWGGAYQDGQKEVFFKPFNAAGTKLLEVDEDAAVALAQ